MKKGKDWAEPENEGEGVSQMHVSTLLTFKLVNSWKTKQAKGLHYLPLREKLKNLKPVLTWLIQSLSVERYTAEFYLKQYNFQVLECCDQIVLCQ